MWARNIKHSSVSSVGFILNTFYIAYLFIIGLFNDTVNSLDYTAWNKRIISE
jgi:hypothetical protein